MSILNMESDGLPHQVPIAVGALRTFKCQSREDLMQICAPELVVPRDKRSRMSGILNRWTAMGLFTEADSFGLAPSHQDLLKVPEESLARELRKRMCSIVLAPENNTNFWNDKEMLAADFTRGLSWLLAQDIYQPPTGHKSAEDLEKLQFRNSDKWLLKNDTRWNGLVTWATYLGFAKNWRQAPMIDPTPAIIDVLPDVIQPGEVLSARDFVQNLAAQLPVLDFGEYRQQVEEELDDSHWRKLPPDQLSMSLSRAIQRLFESHILTPEQQADERSGYHLTGVGYRKWRWFTHVRRMEAN